MNKKSNRLTIHSPFEFTVTSLQNEDSQRVLNQIFHEINSRKVPIKQKLFVGFKSIIRKIKQD